mmetsp:Transcript_65540/g.166040  ORF Transcript_65540/g.166040 Transcript_65540/m.166040 type:complete len:517 (-) Transcript_65540:186-1736(-)
MFDFNFWVGSSFVLIVLINALWITRQYKCWCRDFASRPLRVDEGSPSNKPLPRTSKDKARRASDEKVIATLASGKLARAATHALAEEEEEEQVDMDEHRTAAPRIGERESDDKMDHFQEMCRNGTKTPKEIRSNVRSDAVPSVRRDGKRLRRKKSSERAEVLNFDHVHLTWWSFLWGSYFVEIPAALQVIAGMFMVTVRGHLSRMGLMKPRPCDPAKVVGELLLETMQAVHMVSMDVQAGRDIAHFVWVDLCFLGSNSDMVIAPEVIVDVDVNARLMTGAEIRWLSGKKQLISATQAITLISCNTIMSNHVTIHASANWGLNPEAKDPFVKQNAIVTVIYNYFGARGFSEVRGLLYNLGLVSVEHSKGFLDSLDHSMKKGVPPHKQVVDLLPYSDVVTFVVKARRHFLTLFDQYKNYLEDIDGEAMFIGTVLHSLDHSLWCKVIGDPLWFDVKDPVFGKSADLMRITRAGFADDLPAVLFTKKYRDASHPFYKTFYEKVVKINKELADMMDTCIIK